MALSGPSQLRSCRQPATWSQTWNHHPWQGRAPAVRTMASLTSECCMVCQTFQSLLHDSEDGRLEPCQSGLVPCSPASATGWQPQLHITPAPRAANPHNGASRSSTCTSVMQTTKQEEQEEREPGRSGSQHTKPAQVKIYRIRHSIRYPFDIAS